jgi:hypothetical protein
VRLLAPWPADAAIFRVVSRSRPLVHLSVIGTVVPGANEGFIYECLESLFATTGDAPFDLRVTVVDNSPGSGFGRRVAARFPGVELMENAERRGFATNHNAALRGSDAEYYAIANDDIVFQAGALARAVSYLEDAGNARVAVVGFRLRNPDGTLQPSTYRFPSIHRALVDLVGLRPLIPFAPWSSAIMRLVGRGGGGSRFWAHDRTVDVQTFRGALMLVRGSAARAIGPMDEVSLIGGEETEWHKRFADAGWRTVFLHDAEIVHHGSQTLAVAPRLRAEYLKGLLNYFRKHRSPPLYWAFRMLAVTVLAFRALPALVARDPGRRAHTAALLRTALKWPE